MKDTNCDARPRIHIDAHRDGSAGWKSHPAGKGQYAPTPGAAFEAAIAEIGDAPAVVIWSGRAPP